jgi:S1-C subfamily serine protease
MLAVEGHPVQTVSELLAQVAALKPGARADLLVLRKREELVLSVTPAQRPKAKTAQR